MVKRKLPQPPMSDDMGPSDKMEIRLAEAIDALDESAGRLEEYSLALQDEVVRLKKIAKEVGP